MAMAILPLLKIFKTIIGMLFSRQRLIAEWSIIVRYFFKQLGIRPFLRVIAIDAIDLCRLYQQVCFELGSPQCRTGIGCEEWIACSSGKNCNSSVFKVVKGTSADKRLTHSCYFNGA